jgi:cell division protein FtsA
VRTGEAAGFLDIGTSKVCCLIAAGDSLANSGWRRSSRTSSPHVIGFGLQRARGVKAGVIVDLDDAEQTVRAAVDQAERMAGTTLGSVFAGVACGRISSRTLKGHVDLENGIVRKRDIARLDAGARAFAERGGRKLIAMNRIGYRLDGTGGIRDPLGMAGRRLTAELHAVTADEAPLRNLMLLIERCHLATCGLAPTALASALAATTEEERRLGVTCLDIGGGAATIAVFLDGHFVLADSVPIGGNCITSDIARTLLTPLAEAERIKTLYGTLAGARSDEHEAIAFPLAGEAEPALQQTTKAALGSIVRQRVEGLLQLVRERLDRSCVGPCAGDRIVLTGGTSQLLGIGEFVARTLGRPVRVGGPRPLDGMPGSGSSPAFSSVIGLVVAAQSPEFRIGARIETGSDGQSYFGRIERWLQDSF